MFDLSETYTAWQEDPASFWGREGGYLEQFSNPDIVLDEDGWGQLLSHACPAPAESGELHNSEAVEWLNIIVNNLKHWSLETQRGKDPDACREALEKLLFLARLHFARLDAEAEKIEPLTRANGTMRSVKHSLGVVGAQLCDLLDAVARTVQMAVAQLYPPTAGATRGSLALLYLEPSCRLLQHPSVASDPDVVVAINRVLCLGVKLQQQHQLMRTQLLQLLTYYEHSSSIVVRFLDTLSAEYNHTALADTVLRALTDEAATWMDSQSTASAARARCVNAFLKGIAETLPQLVASNMPAIAQLLSSPFTKLRLGAIEVAPIMVSVFLRQHHRSKEEEGQVQNTTDLMRNLVFESGQHEGSEETALGDNTETARPGLRPAIELVKLVEPRVNDVSHFVRAKATAALIEFCLPALLGCRGNFIRLAVMKMQDRSQLVRRQALALVRQLLKTHTPLIHPGNLSHKKWSDTITKMEAEIDQLMKSNATDEATAESLAQLEAGRKFAQFTLDFIEQCDEAVAVARSLLQSRAKSDVLDAVELLVTMDAYHVDSCADALRSMVHLVWVKADNDEGNAVAKTAVRTYYDLYMSAPPELTEERAAHVIAKNLIDLTVDASQGYLTSLEKLLSMAVDDDMLSVAVIRRLWTVYKDIRPHASAADRRGAAIVLGMLSLADRSIACAGIGPVTTVGLGKYGRDDYVLATHSCTILKRAAVDDGSVARLPSDFHVFEKIVSMLLRPAPAGRGLEWMAMAKEALQMVVATCQKPSEVYSRLLSAYVQRIFTKEEEQQQEQEEQEEVDPEHAAEQSLADLSIADHSAENSEHSRNFDEDVDGEDVDANDGIGMGGVDYDSNYVYATKQRMQLLGQHVYLVGEIALNLLVYLDRCEAEFKKITAKNAADAQANEQNEAEREEEMMGGGGVSPEDNFQDAMRDLRENMIFYSDRAMLKPFTGLVAEICQAELGICEEDGESLVAAIEAEKQQDDDNNSNEVGSSSGNFLSSSRRTTSSSNADAAPEGGNNPFLAIAAGQTLSKFMCISARFCSEHMPLVVSLMSKHPDNVVRSNFVVALSDIAICFNQLIDAQTEHLYDRLNDKDEVVQRTCIVSLTLLILSGQIKVKGRLSEIAKAIVHENVKISSLAKMFFNELAAKENAVYNSFLDVLSTLLRDDTFTDTKMMQVLRFLAQKLDKEKQMKKLTDKILVRMRRCDTQRQWNAYQTVLTHMHRKIEDESIKQFLAKGFTGLMEGEDDDMPDEEEDEMDDGDI